MKGLVLRKGPLTVVTLIEMAERVGFERIGTLSYP